MAKTTVLRLVAQNASGDTWEEDEIDLPEGAPLPWDCRPLPPEPEPPIRSRKKKAEEEA